MMLMTVYLKSTPSIRDKAVFIAVWKLVILHFIGDRKIVP